MMQRTKNIRRAAYQLRFVGRSLDAAVGRRLEDRTHASEADVGRWLEIEPSTFNRWINGHAHPRTEDDWVKLTELGLPREVLRRLELLDKLDAWRRDLDLSLEDVASLGVQILAERSGKTIFRAS
jgi:hypothetical protein